MYTRVFMTYLLFIICAEPTVCSGKTCPRSRHAHTEKCETQEDLGLYTHTQNKSLLGQSVHSYFIHKTTNVVACDVIHRLYPGILYFNNVIVFYFTRVNVIFYASNKSISFLAPIITQLRMFNNILYIYLITNFKQIGQ
jgi:hypothetical protein